jgi:hypothetical protein
MRTEHNESTPSETTAAKSTDTPCGRFASIGGKRIPVYEFEKLEKPIDFSSLGGKLVREAPTYPLRES